MSKKKIFGVPKKVAYPAAIVLLLFGVGGFLYMNPGMFQLSAFSTQSNNVNLGKTSCSSTGLTGFSARFVNSLNATGAEYEPVSLYIYNANNQYVNTYTAASDGTYATAINLGCPGSYTVDTVASNSVNSMTYQVPVTSADIGALKDQSITEYSAPQFRVYDNDNAGFVYSSLATSANTFNTSASISYYTTSSNSTGLAVGTNGQSSIRIDYQTQNTDGQFGDEKLVMLVNAPVTDWATPSVTQNGVTLSNIYSTLSDNDKAAYNGYQYAYVINTANTNIQSLTLDTRALSGVNPTSNITVAFRSYGRYLSVDGKTVKEGLVTDASSRPDIQTGATLTFVRT